MHKRCRYTPPCKKGWRKGVAKKMNPCELCEGVKHEREHFKDARRACRTAVDHLAEHPDYYTRLKRAKL